MEYGQIHDKDEVLKVIRSRLVPLYKSSKKSYDLMTKETGLVKKTLSDVINGRAMPSMNAIFAIADCLNEPFQNVISGLELFIVPRGHHKRKDRDSQLTEIEYSQLIDSAYGDYVYEKMERMRYFDAEDMGDSVVIEDDSMELLGLHKGYQIIFNKVCGISQNGGIYVCRIDGKIMIRRIWKVDLSRQMNDYNDDIVILIPYSSKNQNEYEIIERFSNEIDILGMITSIDVAYNKTNNLL